MKTIVKNFSKRFEVWNKTNGKCWYCGIELIVATKENRKLGNMFTVEHVDNLGGDEINNLVPSCATCNKMKKQRTLEEFRTYISMPMFNEKQEAYLNSFGIKIPKPRKHLFYGETL